MHRMTGEQRPKHFWVLLVTLWSLFVAQCLRIHSATGVVAWGDVEAGGSCGDVELRDIQEWRRVICFESNSCQSYPVFEFNLCPLLPSFLPSHFRF